MKPLDKRVLMPLGLAAEGSAAYAAIYKKMFRSGNTTSIVSIKEVNDVMRIINSLEKHGLLIKAFSETIKNKATEQKGRFLSVLLGLLYAS